MVGCLQYLLICCMWAVLEYCLLAFTSGVKNNLFFFLLFLKIHIQRTEGCDHMTCSQCNTNFCYRCGERYRQLRFFGDHTSNLSIFGCKYRYLPERPHLRRLVRGSVCAGKLLITPLILILGLALGAVAVVVGLFVFPIYCLCKKQRKRSRTGMPCVTVPGV
uniref:RING-type domain-containing protein n=1 Tax=Chrysolophus pictus TaxID=9089 RepID=A0A8C3LB09_CHRPC